jgi:NAD(P)-dependent dehydrogenase (short-subunit alcohol dehydrogenase family)
MNKPVAQITPALDPDKDLVGLFDLKGQVAFVPGGAGGIGEAVAWSLAKAGASLAIAGRDIGKAKALADLISKAGHRASAYSFDVSDIGTIEKAVGIVEKDFGQIDILANCVGIQIEQPITEVTEEAFDQVYTSNLKSAMFLAQAVAKRQIPRKSGRQIHLLSVRSQLGLRDRGYSAYCATKGGLVMLIKQHAMELARHNITVNGVAPTFVYTEMIRHVMENPEFRKGLETRIPLGRIASPIDVAGPVLFFAAPGSSFVTGQIMYVDGGITASQ